MNIFRYQSVITNILLLSYVCIYSIYITDMIGEVKKKGSDVEQICTIFWKEEVPQKVLILHCVCK